MSITPQLVLAQMYWSDHMDRDQMRWWMPIVWLVSLAIVALAVVAVVRLWSPARPAGPTPPPTPTSPHTPAPPPSAARTILAERYARGELTTEELRERAAALDEVERGGP